MSRELEIIYEKNKCYIKTPNGKKYKSIFPYMAVSLVSNFFKKHPEFKVNTYCYTRFNINGKAQIFSFSLVD